MGHVKKPLLSFSNGHKHPHDLIRLNTSAVVPILSGHLPTGPKRTNMHFIQITESVRTEERDRTCIVKALLAAEATTMEDSLRNSNINFSRREQDCVEAETSGVAILNILGGIGYKVYGQSMAMEESIIGGRTILVQKLVWTVGK